MLFSLLLFLQMTGISPSLRGVCWKATPCRYQTWCHQKGTVINTVSLLSLLLCSPFLPLLLCHAGKAPAQASPPLTQPITQRWHSREFLCICFSSIFLALPL